MNYPNLPNSNLEITSQPEVKEITNELLKQLQSALNSNTQFNKEGLGDIDLVWGNKDYGLEHILKRRESDAIDKGVSKEEAKKYALEIINNIPNIISNGKLSKDDLGRLKIEFKNQRVGLNDSWKGETLNNRWVITSYEIDKSRNGLIESPLAPNYKGKDTNPLNLNPNSNTKN